MGERSRTNPVTNFIAGGVGGVCLVASGHPFDLVKVRLQTAPMPAPGEAPMFSGMLDCFKKTIGNEGFFAVYKGMAAPLCGVVPMSALFFFGSAIGKRLQQSDPNEQLKVFRWYLDHYSYGAYGKDQMRSADVPASGFYLGGYELLMRMWAGDDRTQLNPLVTLVAGGLAGMANWGWAIMPDVLKSRLQTAPDGKYPRGLRDVLPDLLKHEGPRALFKGFVPVVLRSFPANACMFLGYEFSMKLFNMIGF